MALTSKKIYFFGYKNADDGMELLFEALGDETVAILNRQQGFMDISLRSIR
jgi:hypothetical protein